MIKYLLNWARLIESLYDTRNSPHKKSNIHYFISKKQYSSEKLTEEKALILEFIFIQIEKNPEDDLHGSES